MKRRDTRGCSSMPNCPGHIVRSPDNMFLPLCSAPVCGPHDGAFACWQVLCISRLSNMAARRAKASWEGRRIEGGVVMTVKSDTQIHQDVLRELHWDSHVGDTEVGVEVDQGVVTLTGTVESYAK